MKLGVMGKKVGMTQVFDKNGLAVPVTVVKLGENIVTDKKSKEKHGYTAVQVGGFKVLERKLNKPELGNFKKKELAPMQPIKDPFDLIYFFLILTLHLINMNNARGFR